MDWTNPILIYVIGALFLVVVVGAFVVLGKKRRSEIPQNPYVEALALLVDGEQKKAFAKLQESVRSGTAPTDAYIRLGKMLREAGDAGKALQIHKSLTVKADLTRAEKIELFVNVAKDYSALGKPDQAVKVLETAVKKMSLKEPRVFFILAREYHLLGSTENAYGQLKELARAGVIGNRELSLYLGTVGEQEFDEGHYKEARKLLHRSLRRDEKNAGALYTLGNLEEKQGESDEAVEHWRKAALVSPEFSSNALRNLERVVFQQGRFSDVERVYGEVLEARPWDEYATLALADFYRKKGRGREAIDFLEEFRSMHPESIGATLLLTSLYATLDDPEALDKFLDANESFYARTSNHTCGSCGFQSGTMRWHCPRCNKFDSFSKNHEK